MVVAVVVVGCWESCRRMESLGKVLPTNFTDVNFAIYKGLQHQLERQIKANISRSHLVKLCLC